MPPTSGVRRRLFLGLVLGASLVASLAGTASAHVVLVDEGTHGNYSVTDTYLSNGATCGFSLPNEYGVVFFRWLRAKPPTAFARNSTGQRDQQRVRWTFFFQHRYKLNSWKTIGQSSQTKTAYDDTKANFSALRIYSNGGRFDGYRAEVKIEWLRPNGTVAGKVRYRIQFYKADSTVHDAADYFYESCPGANLPT